MGAEDGRALSRSGTLYAALAYASWGVTPIYWKQLASVPSSEILAHRVLGSWLLAIAVLISIGRIGDTRAVLARPRERWLLLGTALLLSVNWWIFIWAVNADRIVETSLGYYLTPLLSVAFGVVIYRERLSRVQTLAALLAGIAVAYMAWDFGRLPWPSLVLGISFALYGAMRKATRVSSIGGLAVECCVMAIPALVYLVRLEATGDGSLLHEQGLPPLTVLFLLGSGVVTALPLVWFASAARRLPLSAVGLFQYIAPSLSLAVAVWLYDEPFTATHLVTFGLIWVALALYSWESFGYRPMDVSPDH